MNDPLDTELFSAIERVSTSSSSFSGMLEYFQVKKPEQWRSLVDSLMEISKREYSNVSVLGFKLEEMIDDYAAHMNSDPEI